MSEFSGAAYGDGIADIYDALYPELDDRAVAVLAELAGTGRALELGIGTGRVALPLQAAGVHVEGIDVSGAMIAKLREKPGRKSRPSGVMSAKSVVSALIPRVLRIFTGIETRPRELTASMTLMNTV